MTDTARLVAERLAALPGLLTTLLDTLGLTLQQAALTKADQPILVTGGGMSEGPARLLVALLTEAELAASFVPLSEFVAESLPGSGGTLLLFSQGLAPNARFPLGHRDSFRRVVVLTSVVPDFSAPPGEVAQLAAQAVAAGVELYVLPPKDESGLLLRVLGPAVQALAAACLAGLPPHQLAPIPARYAELLRQDPPGSLLRDGQVDALSLVAGGRYGDACVGLRWKLLEGLLHNDPPIWDLLQVAHGPLQALWDHSHTLVLLSRADAPHEAALRERLEQVLTLPRHRLLTLPATTLPGLLAYFEHAAQLDRLLLDALWQSGRDLVHWPAKHQDGPLYNLQPPQPLFPKPSP